MIKQTKKTLNVHPVVELNWPSTLIASWKNNWCVLLQSHLIKVNGRAETWIKVFLRSPYPSGLRDFPSGRKDTGLQGHKNISRSTKAQVSFRNNWWRRSAWWDSCFLAVGLGGERASASPLWCGQTDECWLPVAGTVSGRELGSDRCERSTSEGGWHGIITINQEPIDRAD